jgi:hypothetical protein
MNKAKKIQKKKILDEVSIENDVGLILKYNDEGFNYAVNGLGSGFNGVGTSGSVFNICGGLEARREKGFRVCESESE